MWLALAAEFNLGPGTTPYQQADFNLDRVVDVSDFGIWNGAKFTVNSAFCSGNANADAVVDVTDFGIWNTFKFTAADSGASIVNPSANAAAEQHLEVQDGAGRFEGATTEYGGRKNIENILALQRPDMNLFVESSVRQEAIASFRIGPMVTAFGERAGENSQLSPRDIVDVVFALPETE